MTDTAVAAIVWSLAIIMANSTVLVFITWKIADRLKPAQKPSRLQEAKDVQALMALSWTEGHKAGALVDNPYARKP